MHKNSISPETTQTIIMFYQSDSISRVMPGKADCITVKDPVDNTSHTNDNDC